jgi:hypothetical protein
MSTNAVRGIDTSVAPVDMKFEIVGSELARLVCELHGGGGSRDGVAEVSERANAQAQGWCPQF